MKNDPAFTYEETVQVNVMQFFFILFSVSGLLGIR